MSMSLCSCQSKLEKEVDAVNEGCNMMLGSSIDDFPDRWNKNFKFKETTSDGLNIYTCGTHNGSWTYFIYKNGIQVGLRTSDPQFGFSIFGKTIGYPGWGTQNKRSDCLMDILIDRGYGIVAGSDVYHSLLVGLDNIRYSWTRFSYEEKLYVSYAWDVDNQYTCSGSIGAIEFFLNE